MNKWLANLKVGDTVIVNAGGETNSRFFRSTVKRLTKTLIFTAAHTKFRRRDGHVPGEWATGLLLEPTPENLEDVKQDDLRVRRMQMARKLRGHVWHMLPLKTLEAVETLLEEMAQ